MTKKSVKAVGCFIAFNNKFLVLKRHPNNPQGDTWGLAGGKIEQEETASQAVVREIKEEINLTINECNLRFLGEYTLEYPDMTVRFSAFATTLDHEFVPTLEKEKSYDYKWVSVKECYALPDAMQGLYVLLEKTGSLKLGKLP